MFCNIGLKTDCTLGKSALRFKHISSTKFDTPIAICDNGNISQLVKSLKLNKMNIPAVELYITASYQEKRAPIYSARFFAFNLQGYKSICKMIEVANRNKYYSPRIAIHDLILDGDILIIVDPDFLFINELPKEKIFVAVNANEDISNNMYLKYNPIFYYDSYGMNQRDISIVEALSARQFKHEKRVWYNDISHYNTASFIRDSIDNYKLFTNRHKTPVIEFENRYPIFCNDPEDYFDALVEAGFRRKCPQTKEYRDRLDYEKNIIKELKYCNYFLINWDFINWSRKNDIPIGPGRGSAAGSIVAYCLDITKLDPISNGLYFERFLNPERISPPDIDTDINTDDRQLVIDYIKEKYGTDYVSQIITFSELKSKSALKDAARLHGIPAEEANKITSYFPPSKFGVPPTLLEAYEVQLVRDWADSNQVAWKEAINLEGFIRQTGIHAAGLIISPEPINSIVGISYADNEKVCQFDKDDAEKFGLLKMDFLGLSTLGLIKNILNLLGKSYYDLENLKLDDPKVIKSFANGDTHGIFQFESDGMRKLLTRINPTSFADIAAATALYRPGPLTSGLAENYIHNKHSINPEYYLPIFKELLAETYGVFVYQEQVMLVSQRVAGFSLPKADTLRKAIGKKDRDLMKTLEVEFVDGAVKNGYIKDSVEKLWQQIVKFADYCFNKSHSYAYALLSYWTMYLKVYHPNEFAVCLLSLDMKDTSKLRSHFFNFKDRIAFLPPYIDRAGESFKLDTKGVMIGFGSIKGLGNVSNELPKYQPYKNIIEVFEKVKLDKAQLASLIYSGAFDELEKDKSVLLGNLERILKFNKSNEESDIFNLFSPSDVFSLDYNKRVKIPSDSYMEKSCYGFNIHYGYINENKWLIDHLEPETIIGVISDIKRTKTKAKQQDMAILTVDGVHGRIKAVLFPSVYDEYSTILQKEETYAFLGELKYNTNNENENEPSLLVKKMMNEHAISVCEARLYTQENLKLENVYNPYNFSTVKDGFCELSVYEEDLDGESLFLFKIPKSIYYDQIIHNKFKDLGLRPKLRIF